MVFVGKWLGNGVKACEIEVEVRHRAAGHKRSHLAARQILTDARRVDHDARMLSRGCFQCRVLAVRNRKGGHPDREGWMLVVLVGSGVTAGLSVRLWHPELEGTLTAGTKRGRQVLCLDCLALDCDCLCTSTYITSIHTRWRALILGCGHIASSAR